MEFSGMIQQVGEVENLTSQDGRATYYRREVVLKTVEEYPQTIVLTLSSDLAQSFSGQAGQQARAFFSFKAQQAKESQRYFNSLRCWRIDVK